MADHEPIEHSEAWYKQRIELPRWHWQNPRNRMLRWWAAGSVYGVGVASAVETTLPTWSLLGAGAIATIALVAAIRSGSKNLAEFVQSHQNLKELNELANKTNIPQPPTKGNNNTTDSKNGKNTPLMIRPHDPGTLVTSKAILNSQQLSKIQKIKSLTTVHRLHFDGSKSTFNFSLTKLLVDKLERSFDALTELRVLNIAGYEVDEDNILLKSVTVEFKSGVISGGNAGLVTSDVNLLSHLAEQDVRIKFNDQTATSAEEVESLFNKYTAPSAGSSTSRASQSWRPTGPSGNNLKQKPFPLGIVPPQQSHRRRTR